MKPLHHEWGFTSVQHNPILGRAVTNLEVLHTSGHTAVSKEHESADSPVMGGASGVQLELVLTTPDGSQETGLLKVSLASKEDLSSKDQFWNAVDEPTQLHSAPKIREGAGDSSKWIKPESGGLWKGRCGGQVTWELLGSPGRCFVLTNCHFRRMGANVDFFFP